MELQAGQNIVLNQSKLRISVVYPKTVQFSSDVDASAFMLSVENKVRGDDDFIFFNQPSAPNGSLNLISSEESSLFILDLNRIDRDIVKIAITLVIDGADTVSGLQHIKFSIDDVATFNIPFLKERTEKALILGEFYQHNGNWKFRALGAGFNGGLEPLAINYGVEISTPTPTPTPMPISSVASSPSTISLEKRIEQKAPHLVSLAKTASISLTKYNLQSVKAKVAFVLDASGSMHTQFKKGYVQSVLERIAVLAVQFDDDGSMDVWCFAEKHRKYEDVTLDNLNGYIERLKKTGRKGSFEILPGLGGTNNEPPCMTDVVDFFENSKVPVYVVFITDGGISKSKQIKEVIRRSANHAIFWKFVGLGGRNYGILQNLDNFTDRRIDNTNFFSIDDFATMSDETLYNLLLQEFNEWNQAARKLGIIT